MEGWRVGGLEGWSGEPFKHGFAGVGGSVRHSTYRPFIVWVRRFGKNTSSILRISGMNAVLN
jgi:hypothetical protein